MKLRSICFCYSILIFVTCTYPLLFWFCPQAMHCLYRRHRPRATLHSKHFGLAKPSAILGQAQVKPGAQETLTPLRDTAKRCWAEDELEGSLSARIHAASTRYTIAPKVPRNLLLLLLRTWMLSMSCLLLKRGNAPSVHIAHGAKLPFPPRPILASWETTHFKTI